MSTQSPLIRDTEPTDARAVSALIDAVARERRFLAGTSGFPEDATASFIASVRAANGVHLVATLNNEIVGWCDITRIHWEGMTHVGRLGMGVGAGFRGRGLGKALLVAALERAARHGLERVELEVYRSNAPAVRLYETHGFVREGVKVKARRLDGRDDDLLLYAAFPSA